MNGELGERVEAALDRPIHPAIADYARLLAAEAGASAVLFYGSNLRTGSLEGVIDFYILLPGSPEKGLWPRVSYREWTHGDIVLRAKIATMTLDKFSEAARGETIDTTIWTRFVQPSAMVLCAGGSEKEQVVRALADAVCTASRLAVAVGPESGCEEEYWRALFRATYGAEMRVENPARADAIIEPIADHFDGLLVAGLRRQNIAYRRSRETITPLVSPRDRADIMRWWRPRRRLGKALNILRLLRATRTFEGAGRYAAWKVQRHTGVEVEVTPWREKHPLLAAPGVLWKVWRSRRSVDSR